MASTIDLPVIPNDRQLFYTYEFNIKFYKEDVSIEPVTINNIFKECDYLESINPVLIMNMDFIKTDLFKLNRYQKELLASISIVSHEYMRLPTNESGGTPSALISTNIISSGVFFPLFSPSAFDERYREDEYENKELMSSDTETTITMETDRVAIDVMFEDITIVNSKKTPFNIVADKGVTVGTLLQYIVDALPVKWAIIDKPDNIYTLEETILPPGNLVPTLKTLQYHIGIYENGVMAFHEDDVLYILNKFALDHDCKAGDKIITHIYATELDKMLGGITTRGLDPVSGEAVYTGPITVKPSNREILSAELEGNNFIFSSFRQGLSAVKYTNNNPVSDQSKEVSMVMKRNIETYKHTQEKNVITYDELSNIYNMASMFNEIEATVKQMFIKIENINITDFRPNKFVHLHFLDNQKNLKLGGVYHIISMTTIFIPVNPSTTKEMACVGNVLLSKRSSS